MAIDKEQILAGRNAVDVYRQAHTALHSKLGEVALMQKALHETCLEYFRRRLSEGWSIVWQRGYYLILSSPDGNTLRPVDLRNDILTLRPNDVGAVTQWSIGAGGPANWQCVCEVIPDELTSYVKSVTKDNEDLYALPDHTTEEGIISSVTLYLRTKDLSEAGSYQFFPLIQTEGVKKYGSTKWYPLDWETQSQIWTTNPEVGGAWTWTQIDALQAGIRNNITLAAGMGCTQVYVEVDYGPVAKPPTFRLDPRPGHRMRFHPNLQLG